MFYKLPKQLEINNLTVSYPHGTVLQNIFLTIESGKLIGIIGPNGAGKSTLLKTIIEQIKPISGEIFYQGAPLNMQRARIGYVPQRAQVDWDFPINVWDVVMMARLKKTGWFSSYSKKSYESVKAALEKVDMLKYKDRNIRELSGGQQQRVFLARLLAQEADLLLLDEPFTGVDFQTQKIIFSLLKEQIVANKIVIVIHHDLGESIINFDELILLNKKIISHDLTTKILNSKKLSTLFGDHIYAS